MKFAVIIGVTQMSIGKIIISLSYLLKNDQYSAFRTLAGFLLRVDTSADLFAIDFWVYVHINHQKVDYTLVSGCTNEPGSVYYRTDDCDAPQNGFYRRKSKY